MLMKRGRIAVLWEGRGEEVEREPVSPDLGSSE